MNVDGRKLLDISACNLEDCDKWILKKYNSLVENITKSYDNYELGIAAQNLYDFIWSDFCDWYIELTKPRLYGEDEGAKDVACSVLNFVLAGTLQLLHPLMPFITEEIWTSLENTGESIMISSWPETDSKLDFDVTAFDAVIEIIKNVRNLRAEMNVPVSKKTELLVLTKMNLASSAPVIEKMASASKVEFISAKPENEDEFATVVTSCAQCYIPMGELVDVEKERARLLKEKERLEGEISRIDKKLSNEGFVSKAPAKVVDEEKAKRASYVGLLENTLKVLSDLQ
jgi:valyl-tRNA synthetase